LPPARGLVAVVDHLLAEPVHSRLHAVVAGRCCHGRLVLS
jgi:hypothetical protein